MLRVACISRWLDIVQVTLVITLNANIAAYYVKRASHLGAFFKRKNRGF